MLACKTVFATHYLELTQLADELTAVRNFNVAVREVADRVLFLHRMEPGGADRSYGIEVGRLAGLPDAVLTRARAVLHQLEREQLTGGGDPPRSATEGLPLFAPPVSPVVARLSRLDPNTMTPLEALTVLATLAEEARRS